MDELVIICVQVWQASEPSVLAVKDTSQYEACHLQCDTHNESYETREQCMWSAVCCTDHPSRSRQAFVEPFRS